MRYSLFDLHQAYKHTYYTCTLQFKYFTFLCLAIAQNQHGIASIVCFSIIYSSFVLAKKAPTVLGKITPLFHRTSLFLDRLSKGELFVLKETSLLVNYTSKKIYFETLNRRFKFSHESQRGSNSFEYFSHVIDFFCKRLPTQIPLFLWEYMTL